MRRKSDILIKYFQLPNTMFLSHEAFGILVRRIMIEDDINGLRYENLDEETANELRRMEQRWETEYQTLRKNNPMVIQAKSSLSVQVNKSTKAFEALRQRLNNLVHIFILIKICHLLPLLSQFKNKIVHY